MLSNLEKAIFFLSLMTIILFLSRTIDITEYSEGAKATFVILEYSSMIGCEIVSVLNFFRFFKKLIKNNDK